MKFYEVVGQYLPFNVFIVNFKHFWNVFLQVCEFFLKKKGFSYLKQFQIGDIFSTIKRILNYELSSKLSTKNITRVLLDALFFSVL